ncbi:MAG: HDOD domain-containing protein, partial [Gemmatimonadetes bacterium]|nr:HDOD domain-containing protein [Gemmatimonadota bacterium]
MSTHQTTPDADQEFGLIVEQAGVRPDLVKQLSLILNYVYGYNTMLARSPMEAASLLVDRGEAVAHVFVLATTELPAAAVGRLSDGGRLPLFLLVPERLLEETQTLASEVGGSVTVLDMDQIPEHGGSFLRSKIDPIFHELGIGALFDRAQHVSFRILQQRVERRLKHLHTLPTLPEVVLRIMEVVADPNSSPEELEEVLRSDPAIVHKLLQVVNTPAFAGAAQKGEWTLHDAIVRLGRRKLGSVALQIKLINSLIKPEESGFDLRRFWIHSVGTAHIAHKIYQGRMVDVDE